MASDKFTPSELRELFRKCSKFVRKDGYPRMDEIEVLYRNKPKKYWLDILKSNDGLMETYIKDDSGHSENLINGEIDGLFFSGRLCGTQLELPTSSPFGDFRLKIDCFSILNPIKHNYYFADFYCNKEIHYVTIVVCVIGSDTDNYCKTHLPEIKKFTNAFIKYAIDADTRRGNFYINNNIWIEIFYTEDIDVTGKLITKVRTTGIGSSKAKGVPNNKNCTICNL